MKVKTIFGSALAGVISMALSYYILLTPVTLIAISIRRKMPEAWFAGLIVWYALFFVLTVSAVVGIAASTLLYKDAIRRNSN
jgi:glucan phosphoethanolaminetransferase (alkaline phosphatase superfamily)